jgi:spore maturation protein CgeB
MNILVIGKFDIEGFALHIAETLLTMGHNVGRFEPGVRTGGIGGKFGHRIDQVRTVLYTSSDGIPAIRAMRMRALWDMVNVKQFDLVIVSNDFLWPNEVSELKSRTGALVVMWYPDALVNFRRGYFMNAPYDGLFFKDPYIKRILGDVLVSQVHYLPECFNPTKHWLPAEQIGNDPKYQCDITTAGSQHSWRVASFRHLAQYNVKLWGSPAPLWMSAGAVIGMHQGEGVYHHDKVKAFRGASIVINNLHYGEIWGLNARAFEVAGAGAFQMVDWRPGLGQLFDDGKELVSFSSMNDLKQKIDYWLPRHDERHAIAQAGMQRAHAEHTYTLRLQLLLDTLAGRANGFPTPRALEAAGIPQ